MSNPMKNLVTLVEERATDPDEYNSIITDISEHFACRKSFDELTRKEKWILAEWESSEQYFNT